MVPEIPSHRRILGKQARDLQKSNEFVALYIMVLYPQAQPPTAAAERVTGNLLR